MQMIFYTATTSKKQKKHQYVYLNETIMLILFIFFWQIGIKYTKQVLFLFPVYIDEDIDLLNRTIQIRIKIRRSNKQL
ncbi:unnamed protein product [Paramecium sonneborni]|uniref:Uncharacterized protein n=1 Tax=Paramecium sonneborni TaxID=65129 RepID=A0A8S1Q1M3_9CILI|nr:unnamed protein product [Paramecium sonneborni]CAD8109155.1 unnamed protein product [Paramecium sonneborni]